MASPQPENPKEDLLKKIRSHEVAISELNNLPPSRAAYQRNCNIFFRRNIKTAIAFEQKQLDSSKSQLQKLNVDL
ncbi:uncharacterized protein LOC109708209 isoform X2 [Ananas comosus]|uniref:Uncharacterized protein LOC109708209 isoform X2 n=1 Tax=Ananas comosus TaxID=4615 RepID=A0A6P5EPM3_ANACO|nr:uncharacterized protein LOC109708209 isoform X2 [Ananas comosus]XP_020085446.1 uncharacterized protein LOC109708209 isoform X2 [Ananas comosus]XP_020085447.1 uncharacterized protein LOC109708209 isoform X2 [Ananas comosus]